MGEACIIDFSQVNKPEPGAVLSPWIKVTFKKADRVITVGNESYPNQHTACIKDFEFGHENGLECRVTIHDEQGGGFAQFMIDLVKDLRCVGGDAQNMDVQFGWTSSACGSEDASEPSPIYKMMCRDVTCNFAGGKFMYEITGVDISETIFSTKIEKIYGGDGNQGIYLTQAIEDMMKDPDYPPIIEKVKWLKIVTNNQSAGSSGACEDGGVGSGGHEAVRVKFKSSHGSNIDPCKGPLGSGKWECDSENKLQAALRWIAPYVSEDDKAIVPYYNSEAKSEIIFWEDFQPNCNDKARDWDKTKHGTYVVNGGHQSNVLEFNPRIRWDWSNMTNPGGNAGAVKPVANENGGKQTGLPECSTINRNAIPTGGSTTTGSADENAIATFLDKPDEQLQIGQARQQKALKVFHYPIEADLVVLGEPRAMRPVNGMFRNIHIVFINPYFITSNTTERSNVAGCGEWIANPLCNEVLSNKAWLVRNITHRINEGKFTTTFGVYLTTPGVDIDIGEPLGGVGSGGWVPPPNCQ